MTPFTVTGSQHANDCVVVAFSTWFGMPYIQVKTVLDDWRLRTDIEGVGIVDQGNVGQGYGTETFTLAAQVLRGHSLRLMPHPDSAAGFFGLVQWGSGPCTIKHLMVAYNGKVYDTDFPEGIGIEDYAQLTGRVIDSYWQ